MRHRGAKPDINVTPLVDIVLVLLIIFMVVVPQLEAGVAVAPPVAEHFDPDQEGAKSPLIVTVTRHGEIYVDKSPVADLRAALAAHKALEPGRPVSIRGDQNATYGAVRKVFSVCEEVGIPGVPLEVGENKEEQKGSS